MTAGEDTAARSARVNRDTDGESLGATVFVDAEQLAELGIDPDAAEVEYQVVDGRLTLSDTGESR